MFKQLRLSQICLKLLDLSNPDATVQVTLAKPDVHYQQWQVPKISAEAGFRRVMQRPFFMSQFP